MIKKAASFIVENPAWTYGKKIVVMWASYEQLWDAYTLTLDDLKRERARSAEWEKAARHARNMVGTIKVVK